MKTTHQNSWKPSTGDGCSQWRDISTAPKDGTLILAVDRNGWREMWWVTNGTDYADYWQDQFDSEPEPTHWMPLPSPPARTQGE